MAFEDIQVKIQVEDTRYGKPSLMEDASDEDSTQLLSHSQCDAVFGLGVLQESRCSVCWTSREDYCRFRRVQKGFLAQRSYLHDKLLKYAKLQVDDGYLCRSCLNKLLTLDKKYTEFQEVVQAGLRKKKQIMENEDSVGKLASVHTRFAQLGEPYLNTGHKQLQDTNAVPVGLVKNHFTAMQNNVKSEEELEEDNEPEEDYSDCTSTYTGNGDHNRLSSLKPTKGEQLTKDHGYCRVVTTESIEDSSVSKLSQVDISQSVTKEARSESNSKQSSGEIMGKDLVKSDVTVERKDQNTEAELERLTKSELEDVPPENGDAADEDIARKFKDKSESFDIDEIGDENEADLANRTDQKTTSVVSLGSSEHNYSNLNSIIKQQFLQTENNSHPDDVNYVYEADNIRFQMNGVEFVRTHTQIYAVCNFCQENFLLDTDCTFEYHLTNVHANEMSEYLRKQLPLLPEIKPFLMENNRYYTVKFNVKNDSLTRFNLFGFMAGLIGDSLVVYCENCNKQIQKRFFAVHLRQCISDQTSTMPVNELMKLVDNLQKLETSIVRWPRPGFFEKQKHLNSEQIKLKRRLDNLRNSSLAVCHLCGKTAKSFYLNNHIRKVHGQLQQCDKCGARVKDLKTHLKFTKHNGMALIKQKPRIRNKRKGEIAEKKPRSSDKEKKKVRQRNRSNRLIVQGIAPSPYVLVKHGPVYVCEVCGKLFESDVTLMEHKHEVYDCHTCDKRFSSREILENHRQKHKGETIECPTCNQTVSCNSLRQHRLVEHLEVFTWICTLCNKLFEEFAFLKRHVRFGHGAKTTPDVIFQIPWTGRDGKPMDMRSILAHSATPIKAKKKRKSASASAEKGSDINKSRNLENTLTSFKDEATQAVDSIEAGYSACDNIEKRESETML